MRNIIVSKIPTTTETEAADFVVGLILSFECGAESPVVLSLPA